MSARGVAGGGGGGWRNPLAVLVLLAGLNAPADGRHTDRPPDIRSSDLYKYSALAARSIRQLPCVSRRTGEAGTCMFAIACAKANGTHLGTCIDRFYFGSCCRLPAGSSVIEDLPPLLETNHIDEHLQSQPTPATPSLVTWTTLDAAPPPNSGGGVSTTSQRTPSRRPPLTESTTTATPRPRPSPSSRPPTTTSRPKPTSPSRPSSPARPSPTRPSSTRPSSTSKPPSPKPTTTRPPSPKPSTSRPSSTKPSSSKPSSSKPSSSKPTTQRPTTTRPSSTPARPTTTAKPPPLSKRPTTTTSKPTIVVSTSTGGLTVTGPSRPPSRPPSVKPSSSKPTKPTKPPKPISTSALPSSTIASTTAAPLTSPTAAAVASTTAPPTTQPDWVQLSVTTHEPTTLLFTEVTTQSPTPGWPELLKPSPARPPVSPPTGVTSSPTLTSPSSVESNVSSSLPSITKPTLSTISPPLPPRPELNEIESLNMSDFHDVCGRRLFPESRIVGGEKSTFGKWPWQVSLRQWRTSTYLHKCGAALLSDNWAITAAHCVENVPPSDLLLRLGEHDLSVEDEPYNFQERRVQIVASHPQFDPRTFEYDLALLRFYEPVKFQPNIVPVCVPEDDTNFVGSTAYVTGWGRLYEDGPLPSVLQEVNVPVINNTVCETMYRAAGYIEHIPDIFICAGWRKGGFDSCEGDSGGPMVIQRPDKRWLLAGVISWGIGCAEPNQPGVYTRISHFRHWINQILQF